MTVVEQTPLVVPASTKLVSLGEVTSRAESVDPKKKFDGTFTYIDLSSVDQSQKKIADAKTLDLAEAPSRARQAVKASDVLVSTVRPNLNGVAVVPEVLDGSIASTGFTVLRPNSAKILASYLFQWVKSPQFIDDMVSKATGASYPAISDKIVRESTIPLPPLPEQRRIAAILDKADHLRAQRHEALTHLDALTQSIFYSMFGDPAINPRNWKTRPIGELASKFSDGPFGSNLKSSHYTETGIRVIRLQNIGVGEFVDKDRAYISEEHFHSLAKHECLPGDVIVGTLGDPNLRSFIQPDSLRRALNKADCVQIRPDQEIANAAYINGLLNVPSTENMAQSSILGQTRARISMGRLRKLIVPVPPLELQQTFARRMAGVERLKDQHRTQLAELDTLFASLQHRAFTGQL